jgi:SAM-dependent methyltransferase
MKLVQPPESLRLPARDFRFLFEQLGPSLGMWRGAEVAVLRSQEYLRPVLDLGCGDGLITSMVLPQVEYGVDPYRPALDRAARRGLYEQLIDRPVEEAEIQPGSIGTVLSNSVFEHLDDPDRIIQAAGGLLKSGGKLIFTTPSDAFGSWLAFPTRRYSNWRNRHFDHHNLWSVGRWADCLERCGLKVVDIQPYFPRRWVRTWDLVDLMESAWIGKHRLAGVAWKRLSPQTLDQISRWAARVNLASPPPGGGRLMTAIKW